MEDLIIKKIESGIRAIKLNTKTPIEAELGVQFTRLKPINEGMYEDLMVKYKKVVSDYNQKNSK